MTTGGRISEEEMVHMENAMTLAGCKCVVCVNVPRLVAEIRYLNARINDLHLGCEVDDWTNRACPHGILLGVTCDDCDDIIIAEVENRHPHGGIL